MDAVLQFSLAYRGNDSEEHAIDLYDAAYALIGFQRSLALTTHLVLNDEIITQAPSLKGARIYCLPPEEGSWKTTAVICAGMYTLTTAPHDTPLGHLIYSAYDYVVSESLGFHVDYDKSLGQLYEEYEAKNIEIPRLAQHQLDSLVEKCSTAITDIHRPIIKMQTAESAIIVANVGGSKTQVGPDFSRESYEYIHESFQSDAASVIRGRVSSYNSNTFKGRIYVPDEGRPVSFELKESCRSHADVQLIVNSLSANAVRDFRSEWSAVYCLAFAVRSRSGHLKRFDIIEVMHEPPAEE